jgi:adenylate kinase
MRIVLLGPPGAGKSTHGEFIARTFGVALISIGSILRENVREGTPVGKMVKAYVDKGELVPGDVITGIVGERLNMPDARKGFVLDGFPRSLPQALALDAVLKRLGMRLDAVVDIKVSGQEIIRRISGRRVCRSCGATYNIYYNPPAIPGVCDVCGGRLYQRADDRAEVVRNRIAIYDKVTGRLIDYYRKQGILIDIDGDGDIMQVNSEILEALESRGCLLPV